MTIMCRVQSKTLTFTVALYPVEVVDSCIQIRIQNSINSVNQTTVSRSFRKKHGYARCLRASTPKTTIWSGRIFCIGSMLFRDIY